MPSLLVPLRRFAAIATLGVLATAQAQTHEHEGVTRHSLAIGQSVALSGPAAAVARPYHQGAKLFFDRLNAAGGIHGRKIELLALDDKGEPAAAAANTKELLSQGVLCLFGYYGAPQVAAAYPLVQNAGAVMVAPLTAADALRGEQYPRLYALRPGYAQEAAAVARHAQTLGVRKLAVLHAGDGETLAALESTQRSLPQLGVQLAATEAVSAGGVQKVMAAAPEAVLLIAGAREAAAAVRQLRAKGFDRQIYAFSIAGESLLADALGPDGNGVVVTRVVPGSDNPDTALARELAAGAAAAHLGRPNVYMMEGYIAAQVLAQALRQASAEPTPARLREALEKFHGFDLGGFRVRSATDKDAAKAVEMAMIDAQGRIRE